MRKLALLTALALAACTGGTTEFLPGIDATDAPDVPIDAPIDAPSSFLLVVDPTDLTVTEGQVTSFNLSLSEEPAAPVTVTILPSDTMRLEAPTQVTFDNDTWATPTPVSVTALGDDDAAPNELTIGLSAPGAQDNVTIMVHVTDDDRLEIVTDPTAIQVTEGLQGTVKVTLSAEPTADTVVTVALNPALPNVASLSTSELTFTAATWDVEQDVIITAEQDLDIANHTSMLTLTSTTVMDPASVMVTIFDDDQVGISPQPSALGTITEGGAPTPLMINLTRDPGQATRVTITPEIAGKVTVNPSFVDFDSSNWNQFQSVNVSGAQDSDTQDDTLDLVLSANLAGVAPRDVSVTVDDDDTPTLQASAASASVIEGNTVQVGVRLAFDPLGPVTVTAAIDNPTIATITAPASSSVTFDSSDYNQFKTITIRGEQDQDLATDATFVRFQATALGASLDVPITKTDDDMQVIEVDMSSVTLTEIGQASFGARLRFRPNGNVTVNVSTGGSSHASVAPISIPFNVGDFGQYKTVTVTGTHDVDLTNDPVTVTLSGASAPVSAVVNATVNDVDVQAIQLNRVSLSINEGQTGTFTVRLSHQPSGNVIVNIGSANPAVATAMPAMITFNNTTWDDEVTVTVTGQQDANANPDMTSITAMGPAPIVTQSVGITVVDDDVLNLQTSVSSLTVTEGMMSSMVLGVRLTQDPQGNVTVNAESLDPAIVALTGVTQFNFSSGDYNTFKYVTVSALNDDNLVDNMATIRFSSVSPMLTATATVTNDDEDTQAISLSVTSVTLLENQTAQFGVRLAFQPSGNVTVQIASADANKATTSGNLTFGPGDWNMFQNVTVTGTPDNNLAQEMVNINVTSPGNAPPRTVAATVNDDDVQTINGLPSTINLTEGNQQVVNINLGFQPSTPTVTVTISTNPTGVASTSANLTFTNSNWMNTQPVTITATQDTDLVNESTTLTLSGASAPVSPTSTVNVTDDDTLTIVPSPTSVTVAENSTGSFTVALSHQPLADTTVTLSMMPTGVATLSIASIPFTTSNWNSPVTVNITPVSDVDNQSESTTVTLSSGVTANASVGITVNDTTVVNQPGWPTYFGQATSQGSATQRIAYKVTTAAGSNWTLDNIGLIASTTGNMAKMAIYTHDAANDAPSMLVTTTPATSVTAGINNFTPTAATLSPSTTYWIAFHVSAAIPIGSDSMMPARRCTRGTISFGDSFPATWGSPSCTSSTAVNVFATLHQ